MQDAEARSRSIGRDCEKTKRQSGLHFKGEDPACTTGASAESKWGKTGEVQTLPKRSAIHTSSSRVCWIVLLPFIQVQILLPRYHQVQARDHQDLAHVQASRIWLIWLLQ